MKSIELLRLQFPGKMLISTIEAGAALGLSPSTVRNRLWKNTFPVPTRLEGDKRMCSLLDLAEYLDSQPSEGRAKRGRPRKIRTEAAA